MSGRLDEQRLTARAYAIKNNVVYLFRTDESFRSWWDANPHWRQAGWLDDGARIVGFADEPEADVAPASASGEDKEKEGDEGMISKTDWIDIHPRRRGGIPTLRGTRITVAAILGEIADRGSVVGVTEAFDHLEPSAIAGMLRDLARFVDRPFPASGGDGHAEEGG